MIQVLHGSVQCGLSHTVQMVQVDPCDRNDRYNDRYWSKSEKMAAASLIRAS